MVLQQRLPAVSGRALAPGMSSIPRQFDLSGGGDLERVDQGLEMKRQALREMEEESRKREAEREKLRANITTILEEKRLLNTQKTDTLEWRQAVRKMDDRLSTARRAVKRFDERWSGENAKLWEYREKYSEGRQNQHY